MSAWLSALRDLVVEATPVRRFMLALLVVVPLVALSTAYWWLNPSAYRVLYPQLSDRASGEVITALEQLDIPYRLSADNGRIEVAADQLHLARYRLAALGLPQSDADAEDAIDRAPSFGASSLQEQQRYQHALEIDLARSIQKLQTIELARVHLALPKVSPFLRNAPPATAAVLLRLRPGARLSAAQVGSIQTMVAASVPRLKRAEVQVLDQHGMVLGASAPERVPSPQAALEQDMVRRALAVLSPWLGPDRVSVQITALLEDSETRQTVERVRNTGAGGRAQEKTVLTTRVPEGRIQRVNAIVILGFDASAAELKRAGQLTRQALGLMPARGDSVTVYALPRKVGAEPVEPAVALSRAPTPSAPALSSPPDSIPRVQPQPVPPASTRSAFPWSPGWLAAGAGAIVLLGVIGWWMGRRPQPVELSVDDFDGELDAVRNQVVGDPRVTADVIKLWMRA
ncbi:MAG: flagellar basal-body MS-ring/collar protein FliF [Thiobacillus sp.]|nr:flagellar basal-body MS-ring/collar protein FliF [Thiobacillus sp.]